jgi:hypothetical protein
MSASPFGVGFIQLNKERFARRMAGIRAGRAHESRRLAEFSQLSGCHFRQPQAQRFEVNRLFGRYWRKIGTVKVAYRAFDFILHVFHTQTAVGDSIIRSDQSSFACMI